LFGNVLSYMLRDYDQFLPLQFQTPDIVYLLLYTEYTLQPSELTLETRPLFLKMLLCDFKLGQIGAED
jgi:hypothetical protein